jgi:tetratricopeptide (TPR) repeat protein
MKTIHIISEMQQAVENADKAFHSANYQSAVKGYNKALQLCGLLPADVVVEFDRVRFEAAVQAGLSAAFGRLGKHMESFAAANKALLFFDRVGCELNAVETGRYLMVLVNQGTALATLGCFTDALEALNRAKEMFNSKGLDSVKNKLWLDTVEGNIVAINAQIIKQQC